MRRCQSFSVTAENLVGRHLSEFLAYSNPCRRRAPLAAILDAARRCRRLHGFDRGAVGRRAPVGTRASRARLLRLDSDNVAAIVVRELLPAGNRSASAASPARRAALLAPVGFELSAQARRDRRVLEWGGDWTGERPRPGPASAMASRLHSGRCAPLVAEPGAAAVGTSPAS